MGAAGRDTMDAEPPDAVTVAGPVDTGRFDNTTGEGRRGRAARGTVINSAFLIGLNMLALIKGFAVAGFVSVSDYGVWGLVIVSFTTLYGLIQVGVNDKYIQQDHEDQESAFQLAFTLQLALSGAFTVLIVAVMPLYALAYDTNEILYPGWVLALAMPASAFQAPLWTFYRRMDYLRQRKLQVFDPVVGFVVTLGLAVAGFGVWSLVLGTVLGAWTAAAVAVRASPYKLRLRYEPGTLREYATFSGPLMFQGLCVAVIGFGPVLVAQRALGTAAIGAMAIANNISVYTQKVDEVVTNTLYPVICAVKDQAALMQEAFLKSNRMGMLWATPTGLAIFLFAPDLVHFVIGSRWDEAIPVIQAFGLIAVFNQIAFNWTAFFRAIGDTKPVAVGAFAMAVVVTGIAVPLLAAYGLVGFAVGMAVGNVVLVGVRVGYLTRIVPLGPMARNVIRGMLPAAAALSVTGAARLATWGGERTELHAAAELALFLVLSMAITLVAERGLLNEFRGYLRRRPGAAAGQPG
ncbi:MAG TPA: oligosaccharide flippase family protein [Thermoleophilaceae bacterium]|nr:oligosaccharide flippase family protein [Thermoleophilaceae bacterium]